MANFVQGDNFISSIYKGTDAVSAMYYQDNILWPSTSPLSGSYLAVGQFTELAGTTSKGIHLLDSNLTSSTLPFSQSIGTGFNSLAYTAVQSTNNTLLVGGIFNTYNGTTTPGLVKLRSNGTIETNFAVGDGKGDGVNGAIQTILPLSNGGAIIGGTFTQWQGKTQYDSILGMQTKYLIKLNPDASIDETFRSGSLEGPSSAVTIVTQDSSGSLFIGGNFNNYYGVSTYDRFLKLNPDGSPNTSFNDQNTISGTVIRDIKFQDDGKVVIAGSQIFVDGENRGNVVRLNPNGSLDTTFRFPGSLDNDVHAITLEPTGNPHRVYAGGPFNTYYHPSGSLTLRNVFRLDETGSVDLGYTLPFAGGIEKMYDLGDELLLAKTATQWNADQPGYVHTVQKYTSTPLLGSLRTEGIFNNIVRGVLVIE